MVPDVTSPLRLGVIFFCSGCASLSLGWSEPAKPVRPKTIFSESVGANITTEFLHSLIRPSSSLKTLICYGQHESLKIDY